MAACVCVCVCVCVEGGLIVDKWDYARARPCTNGLYFTARQVTFSETKKLKVKPYKAPNVRELPGLDKDSTQKALISGFSVSL